MSNRINAPRPAGAAAAYAQERPLSADWLRDRPLLLAFDDGRPASAAAAVAGALVATRGALPDVIRALDLSGLAMPFAVPSMMRLADELLGEDIHREDVAAVRAKLRGLVGAGAEWPVHVTVGSPAPLVVREARRVDAALIVMGLRRHSAVDRAIGDETTLHVVRQAPCPVLAVTPPLTGLPRRAVVGVDFSRASLRAAHAALGLLAPNGTLLLAYAESPAGLEASEQTEGRRGVHALGIDAAFRQLIAELAPVAGITVERAVVQSTPGHAAAEQLLSLVDRADAELLAVGSHRHDRLERWLLGSVTTDLVREGRHSLLVVPPHQGGGRQSDVRGPGRHADDGG